MAALVGALIATPLLLIAPSFAIFLGLAVFVSAVARCGKVRSRRS